MAHVSVSEIKLVSHSNVVYWWPAWVAGYALALYSYFGGYTSTPAAGPLEPGAALPILPGNNPGLFFIAVLLLLIIFTNAKLRGIYSVVTIITLAFFSVLFAWLGWWDDILEFIPNLSARANAGFYFVFATALLIVWLLGFFIFDRLTYWRVRPGQLLEERLIGGSAHSHDTNGLLFEKKEQDFFRHVLLGVGAGDLQLKTKDLRSEVIDIPNVLFVDQKVKHIERLIAVKPEHAAEAQLAGQPQPAGQPVHHDKAA